MQEENLTPNQDSRENGNDMDENGVIEEVKTPLHLDAKKRKLIIIGFAVVLVVIVAIGIARVSNLLNVPLAEVAQNKGDAKIDVSELENVGDPSELRVLDTDGDGINDYDEQYAYETNRYLADSDSDGISDYDEIVAGEDPNCPKGYSCYMGLTDLEGEDAFDVIDPATVPDEDIVVPPADTLRAIILESGVATAAQLNQFTDDQLIDFYTSAIRENPDAFAAMREMDLSGYMDLVDPYDYTPVVIRELFLQNGYTDVELSEIPDEELRNIFHQALSAAETGVVQE